MVVGNGDWRWHHFFKLLPLHVLLRVAAIKPPVISTSHDVLVGWGMRIGPLQFVRNVWRGIVQQDQHHSFFQQDFESWLHTNLAVTDMVVSFNSVDGLDKIDISGHAGGRIFHSSPLEVWPILQQDSLALQTPSLDTLAVGVG
ncbi:hypothetical protein V6N11_054746 [Hibiscus sabdariffa]|uniref:Uncharacterized protein n=1 Tax=Hibiscus sabdariffa TaxID=183260 RepID=A0ABR2S5E0_9ROSI